MGDWSFQKRVRELVEAPHPLLEVEGDAPFYEPPKTPFPDQVFREFEVGLTGLGIEVLDNVVGWNAQNREHFGLDESIFIPAMTGDKTRSVENLS